jgi:hypothetical protein
MFGGVILDLPAYRVADLGTIAGMSRSRHGRAIARPP